MFGGEVVKELNLRQREGEERERGRESEGEREKEIGAGDGEGGWVFEQASTRVHILTRSPVVSVWL